MPAVSKELDEDTGLYYYGSRYLDLKYSRCLSGAPALNDYIPKAPIDDEAKKHNENLPGMGGVFNVVNLHVYHYAGNNPVKYTDPDGESATSTVLGWIGTDIATPEPTDAVPWKWVGYGVVIAGAVAIDYFATKTVSKAIENSKDKKGFTAVVIQIQQNLKGNSNKTLGTSGPILGDPDIGVTKEAALKGLDDAIVNLSIDGKGNGGMVKSPGFQKALDIMRNKIKTTAPLPHGKNILQTFFEYKGVKYRIDLDSYIFDSAAQNLSKDR